MKVRYLKMERLLEERLICTPHAKWNIPMGDFLYVDEDKDKIAWIEFSSLRVPETEYEIGMVVHEYHTANMFLVTDEGMYEYDNLAYKWVKARKNPYKLAFNVWRINHGF